MPLGLQKNLDYLPRIYAQRVPSKFAYALPKRLPHIQLCISNETSLPRCRGPADDPAATVFMYSIDEQQPNKSPSARPVEERERDASNQQHANGSPFTVTAQQQRQD